MNSPDTAPAGGRTPTAHSDLAAVTAWWRGLGGEGFLVLPPPGRSRYTQSDGHEDAAELRATRGLTDPTSFAYWHWQSHGRAFDRTGALTGELLLHWGGDHATVAAGLGEGPAGFRVVDRGPQGAFSLDRITHRDEAGLPDPLDHDGVRQFLGALDEPVDRSTPDFRYRPLSPAEAEWLHERLRDPLDLSAATRFAVSLERRDALTPDETARLLHAWREECDGRLREWEGWKEVLHALLRHGDEQAWELAAALGSRTSDVLSRVPSARGLAFVRDTALGGDRGAVRAWLVLHRSLHEPDAVRAAVALAAELAAHDAPEDSLRALHQALVSNVTADWRRETGAKYREGRTHSALASVRFSTDERLPRALRVLAADAARDQVGVLREEALRPDRSELAGVAVAEALALLDRHDAAREELLAGTGPDLTAYEGRLRDALPRYRTLTDADIRWLRERVADPATDLQGLGFCLELLVSHGEAGPAEVEALVPRRMKDLTKKYRTTYTDWRHPLVTLTCLALDLDHPAAAKLVSWWNRARPLWKDELRPLTHLGAPDEAKAAELWKLVTAQAHDVGQLMTWVLVRARLDGEHPLLVADRLLGTGHAPDHVLHRVLIGVADPRQPLWHYSVCSRTRGWWQRAVEVAEHPDLSPEARAIGLRAARAHQLVRSPEALAPAPTGAERAAALAWIERHTAEVPS
ncbi:MULTISPECIES: hypothetical protein [unclassified Streptomyces]|uniref:hypothetical protein n=1 Tax=unclassified Streptomyces TaxID=2593676 RepID=UPI0006FF37C0|nr:MULTISPECIES: hypothetical protein [unclassified Streptomyces]KQX50624.1 hypothetical protein ASD33_11160 [Streptomyces sp. Root1304]KRA84788.1 hypothetical protein ASE09_11165 [Streptomyces sp. Root66D1]